MGDNKSSGTHWYSSSSSFSFESNYKHCCLHLVLYILLYKNNEFDFVYGWYQWLNLCDSSRLLYGTFNSKTTKVASQSTNINLAVLYTLHSVLGFCFLWKCLNRSSSEQNCIILNSLKERSNRTLNHKEIHKVKFSFSPLAVKT